jgi:hypothetical protein
VLGVVGVSTYGGYADCRTHNHTTPAKCSENSLLPLSLSVPLSEGYVVYAVWYPCKASGITIAARYLQSLTHIIDHVA